MAPTNSILTLDQPATYRIQVVGRLPPEYSQHFSGLEVSQPFGARLPPGP